jgi:hypothetical protein
MLTNTTFKFPVQDMAPEILDPREMFNRVLASWAVDVLNLRKRGWDRPTLRLVRTATSRRSRRVIHRRAA